MIHKISEKGLISLHDIVQKKFPDTTTTGKINEGKIKAIVEKPFLTLFESNEKYNTVYKKAACLLEGIIRFHPFPDGNKRTALLAAFSLLQINHYYLVIPQNTVKFLVSVAEDESTNEEDIDKLINHISEWLKERTATTRKEHQRKVRKFVSYPAIKLFFIAITGIGMLYANKVLNDWYSTKMHPEYKKNMREIQKFFFNTLKDSSKAIPDDDRSK